MNIHTILKYLDRKSAISAQNLFQSHRKPSCVIIVLTLYFIFYSSLSIAATPKPISFYVADFLVQGEVPLSVAEVDLIILPHEGKEFELDGLQNVANELESAIRARGFSFYRVIVPPQSLSDGNVTLKVVSFQVGKIDYKGNQYFSNENIVKSLPGLHIGQSPNTELLAQQLKVANRHPAKESKLTFRQSKEVGFIDATINVQDEAPQLFSLILANTGSDETGDNRLTASYQNANLFDNDHVLNLSYSTSPEQTEDVKQAAISYSLPLYHQKTWLSAYFVYSDIDSGTVLNTFDVAGSGQMSGIHWLQYLPRRGRYEHWLDIGLDSRLFDNDVTDATAGNNDAIVDDIRSTPFSLQYQGEYAWPRTRLGFRAQWLKNTGWGNYNSKSDYSGSGGREGASDSWDSIKLGASIDHNLGTWVFSGVLEGQYADESLISGEQFGLGGSTSVRGYEERETSADSGLTLRTELHAPRWNNITFLGFYDYGYAHMEDVLPGEKESWNLASFGIGARGQFSKHFLFSIDIANVLKSSPIDGGTNNGDFFTHATLVWQY